MNKRIPITVFTGYLGSGKTTIILNVIKQLPREYNMVWLKNEFGDVEVDSQVAKENNIQAKEMINGCLCCVLIGKMGDALEQIRTEYNPDRIIIETSGSAYPAPIAIEIRKLSDHFKLDGIVTVIDALNFDGYKDKSYTAELQAQYTDLILINKHELVTDERRMEDALDDVYELNPNTPKVRTNKGSVNPDLIFGLDTKLFTAQEQITLAEQGKDTGHHHHEVEIFTLKTGQTLAKQAFEALLSGLPRRDFYRIKGMVRTDQGILLLNYVFGRWSWLPLQQYQGKTRISFMGENIAMHAEKIRRHLGLSGEEFYPARNN